MAAVVRRIDRLVIGARFPVQSGAYDAGAVDLLLDRLTSCVVELDAQLAALADLRSRSEALVAAGAPRGALRERRGLEAAVPLESRDRAVVTIEAIRAIVAVVREARPVGDGPWLATVETTGSATDEPRWTPTRSVLPDLPERSGPEHRTPSAPPPERPLS